MTMQGQLETRETSDGVAVLTLNRPERNNAWSVDMEAVYDRHLHDFAEVEEVRVIVVTGAGKSFCPGMDSGTLSDVAHSAASWPSTASPSPCRASLARRRQ
jgi:enoyl-CoA hydratase/carnithine racemase